MKRFVVRFQMWFLNLKFRHKMICTYFTISIIPVVILGTFCYWQARSLVMQQEQNKLESVLAQAVESVSYKLNLYEALSATTVFNGNLADALNVNYLDDYYSMYEVYKTIDSLFNAYKATHKELKEATICTDSLLKHGYTVSRLSEISAEEWYKSAMENYNLQWFSNGKDTLFATRRFPSSNIDSGQNLLQFELDYEKFLDPFKALGEDGCGIIATNSAGELLYTNDLFPKKSSNDILNNGGNNIWKGKALTVKRGNNLFIKAMIPNVGFTVYLSRPMSAITMGVIPIAITVGCMIIGCLLLVFVMSTFFSKTIVRRLEQLNRNMERVKNGQLQVTVTSEASDEMGAVIRTFGEMIKQIDTLIYEVYQSKLSQKEYELKALQAQINPHFLYNSLSLINWKAIKAGEKDISDMSKLLSTFYRTSLNKGKQLITVEDELKNVTSYIAIQLIMHDHEFDVEYDLEPNIYSNLMINLLLQPIVENAIVHGLDYKDNGRGSLKISGRVEGDNLILGVFDNGAGMNEQTVESLLKKDGKGYGMKNVNDRIKLYYGDKYGLHVESSIGEGTYVEVILPIRKS